MDLFRKSTQTAGWMTINIQKDGFCVAHIQRSPTGDRPTVTLAASYTGIDPSDAMTLTKLAKEWDAHRYQRTTLPASAEYKIIPVETPNVPAEECKTAVRWRLKDMLDYPIEDATLDILNIPHDKNGTAKSRPMYAVAAHSQFIEQCQSLFCQAKIPVTAIDIPEMAQLNIATLLNAENRGVALLSFNDEGGLLTITFSDTLYLSRRIDVTLPQLTQTSIEQKNACYDKITLELQRSFDYFDRQYNFITLSRLVLAPLGEAGAGLQEYLAANLYLPVEILNLETLFDFSKVPDLKQPQQQQHYFMVLGAALRDENRASINLYDPRLLERKRHLPAHAMAQALAVIVLGIFLFYGYAWYHITDMKQQATQAAKLHDTTQIQLAQLATSTGAHTASKLLENEVAQSDAQLKVRRQILDLINKGVLGNTQGFSEYFRAFSRQTVDGLWITRFQVSDMGNSVAISGRALQPTQIPVFIDYLKKEKVMIGKTFETLEMHTPETSVMADGRLASIPSYIEFSLYNTPPEQAR